jgi:hypothetical protein
MKITLNRFLDLFAGKNETFKEAREFIHAFFIRFSVRGRLQIT